MCILYTLQNFFQKILDIFINFLLTRKRKYAIFKVQGDERKRGRANARLCIHSPEESVSLEFKISEQEDTPMHNLEEPNHFLTCRSVGCEIASISCITVGVN